MDIYEKNYLTKMNKVSFAASGFGQNLIIGVVNSFLLFFYTQIFIIPLAAVTTLMFIARVFDAANDPVMGSIVDKTRTKWGKLRPYLFATIVPLGIITMLLFYAPNLSTKGKIIYAYITYFSFGIIYTICDVPFWGLASAMTPNPKERVKFITVSRLFHSVGGALPIVLIPLFVTLAKGDLKQGYLMAGIVIGVVGASLFSLAFFGTKERCMPDDKAPTIMDNIRYFIMNRPLQLVVGGNILGFGRSMAVAASLYVATFLLGDSEFNMVILAAWGVSGYIGMLLTPKLTAKFNYKQIYFICSIIGITASLLLLSLGHNLYTIAATMFLGGFPYGIACNINYAMIAESVDYVEWKTGKRTEGVSISFQTLMNKLMSALQIPTVTLILGIVGFVQPIEIDKVLIDQPQTERTLNGIFYMITLMPIIGWILTMIPMGFYNFVGEHRDKVMQELAQRRQEQGLMEES